MSCLRFGTDSLGKEMLELVPAEAASGTASTCDDEISRSKQRDGTEQAKGTGDEGHAPSLPYKGENTIVMMEWERPYMRALVDSLSITEESDVLEIGFGCGYSADRIQELSPKSHTLMEPDLAVLERLHTWAAKRKGVRIVEGFWQTSLPTLGRYDAIFFDDFPGNEGKASRDIVSLSLGHVFRRLFLKPQPESGTHAKALLPDTPESSDLRGPVSRWHAFIDLCVAHHLPIGGRITGYLARKLPLDRPGCVAAPLRPFSVEVPENCPYFPYREAYIPLITRVKTKMSGGGLDRETLLMAPPREDPDLCALPRKRQKRLVLEALVRDSLGLGSEAHS